MVRPCRVSGLALTVCALSACIENLPGEHEPFVSVVVGVHGSPDHNGDFPVREGPPRIETEDGWDVLFAEAFVNYAGVRLVTCDGVEQEVEAYWGEYLSDWNSSGHVAPFGALRSGPDPYCEVVIRHSPAVSVEDPDHHQQPNPEALGHSLWFRALGIDPNDEMVPFDILSTTAFEVRIPLEEPLEPTESHDPRIALTIAFDRVLDGIDLSSASPEQVATGVIANIQAHSYVWVDDPRF